jgi:cellulose biosynthesis protein BcsQ
VNRVIAIVNRKGGSGKTVTVFNLAGAFAEAGRMVLTIDLDPQGSLSKGLKVPVTNLPLSQALIKGEGGLIASSNRQLSRTFLPSLLTASSMRSRLVLGKCPGGSCACVAASGNSSRVSLTTSWLTRPPASEL